MVLRLLTEVRMNKYHPGSELYKMWKKDVNTHSHNIVNRLEGDRQFKSIRQVEWIDKSRNLIVFKDSFKYGYKPRVLGSCVRIIGFWSDYINEPASEKFQSEMKKKYGSNWESDYQIYGSDTPSIA